MGKNGKLDPCYKTFCLILLLLVLASCSLPRFRILNDPLTPEEHINLGVSYEKQGEFDGALKEYTAASRELPVAYFYMGNVYFQKNDIKGAASAYKRAIKKTGDPRAYNNLAWLYYTHDMNLTGAEGLARKAVEIAPDSPDFKNTLQKIIEKRRQQGS